MRGTRTPALDERCGQAVTGHIAQQEMSGGSQRQVEHDGAETGDDTDDEA
jgi:hypothetical protein